VRLANRDQIVAVVVAGRLRLWHGWPLDWNARALLDDVARAARDAVARAPIQKVHASSAAHAAEVRRHGWVQFVTALLLLPALAVGAILSRHVHHRVAGRGMRIFVLLFAIVSGLVLLLRG